MLSADTLIRFKPLRDYNGEPSQLIVFGLDDTYDGDFTYAGSGGHPVRQTLDVSTRGGETPISADPLNIEITVNAVNDPIFLTLGTSPFEAEEDGTVVVSGGSVTNVDGGIVTLAVQAAHGTLAPTAELMQLVQQGELTVIDGDGTDGTLSVSGTTAAINDALTAGLVFTPEADFSGQASIEFTVTQGSDTANASANVDVAPVADTASVLIGDGSQSPLEAAGSPILVSDDHAYRTVSSVTALEHGYVVLWTSRLYGYDIGVDVLNAAIYDSNGNPVGNDFQVNITAPAAGNPPLPYPGTTPGIQIGSSSVAALPGGGFVAVWVIATDRTSIGSIETAGVYAQIFDASGAPVGGEFQPTTAETSLFAGALTTASGFALVWSDHNSSNAHVALYSANGTAAGGFDFRAAPDVGDYHTLLDSFAALSDGSFVVAGTYTRTDVASGIQGFFAHYGADGSVITPVTAVDPGNATDTDVFALPDGGFLVASTVSTGVGQETALLAQRYDSNGLPVGSEIDTGLNWNPSFTALADGGFLLGGANGSQRFDADFNPVGSRMDAGTSLAGTGGVSLDNGKVVFAGLVDVDPSDVTPPIAFDVVTATYQLPTHDTEPKANGTENAPIALPSIDVSLVDTDGSESLRLVLDGYPTGFAFSKGGIDTDNTSPTFGKWIITDPADIASLATTPLTMTPPRDYSGHFTLDLTAASIDVAVLSTGGAFDVALFTRHIDVTINDAPVANNETLTGNLAGFTYNPDNGHWYKVNTGEMSWAAAQAAAAAAGGYLANITSASENAFVANLVNASGKLYAWTGGTDGAVEGEWRWDGGPEAGRLFWTGDVSGSASGYENWHNSAANPSINVEPNGGTAENAMYIRNTGEWVDYPGAGSTPLASVIEVSFTENTPSLIPASFLLANDTDTDNAPAQLSIASVSATETTHGTVTLQGGNVLYTPDPGYTGTARFTYTVQDTNGGVSNEATLTFDVRSLNEAPESIAPSEPYSAAQNSAGIEITLSGSDSDGSVSMFRIVGIEHGTLYPAGLPEGVEGMPINVNDLVVAMGSGATKTATLLFVPDADFTGSGTVQFAAIDNQNAEDATPATITVDVAEASGPVITSGNDATASYDVDENTATVATVTATSANVEAMLTYSIVGGADAISFQINSTTGELTFNPDAPFSVQSDPDFNRYGNGAEDLWYVQFDGSGNAAVYDDLDHFQYFTDVTHFAGYIGGVTVGWGSDGLHWTNVANGTYWLGQYGALYSANIGQGDYGHSVNWQANLPDYENPKDVGRDHTYVVDVQVSDGQGGTDTQTISVNVQDTDAVWFVDGSNIAVWTPENRNEAVAQLWGGSEGTAYYSLVGGDDAGKFILNPLSGAMSFATTNVLVTDGLIATVSTDLDYDRYGFGSDDLGFVQFDGSGFAAVYDDLGRFQFFTDASQFNGFQGGTYIGLDTNSANWENVASGTYWLGHYGTLYSANLGAGNFGEAINMISGGAPDYENPADVGGDNHYNVVVEISNGISTAQQAIDIEVLNVDEEPQSFNDFVIISASAFSSADGFSGINNAFFGWSEADFKFLLANDRDPEGAPLSIAAIYPDDPADTFGTGQLYRIDNPIYELKDGVQLPAHGQSAGSGFYYVVTDGEEYSSASFAYVTVVNYDASQGETLYGGIEGDNDKLDDIIFGAEQAADRINGLGGNDILAGGYSRNAEEADTFVFEPDFGKDTIVGFDHGYDKIDISALDVPRDPGAFQTWFDNHVVQSGNTVVVTYDANNTITIFDQRPDFTVTASDFIINSGGFANGSFETGPSISAPETRLAPGDTIGAWTVIDNPDIAGTGDVDYTLNGHSGAAYEWVASDGDRALALNYFGAGGVQQTFNTTAGAKYAVTFDLSGYPHLSSDPVSHNVKVSAGGDWQTYQYDSYNNHSSDLGWSPQLFTFTATGAMTTLSFLSLDSGGFGPVIDNVAVSLNQTPVAADDNIIVSADNIFAGQFIGIPFEALAANDDPDGNDVFTTLFDGNPTVGPSTTSGNSVSMVIGGVAYNMGAHPEVTSDSFQYRISADGSGQETSSATVHLTIVNGDTLNGTSGDDVIFAGANDTLHGGGGQDAFVFFPNMGQGTVSDFNPYDDKVVLSGFDPYNAAMSASARDFLLDPTEANLSAWKATWTNTGQDSVTMALGNDQITLSTGIPVNYPSMLSNLHANDFVIYSGTPT